MRAQFAHVEGLMKVKDYAVIDATLDHLLDMLRLCRSDNMGVRDLVPAMFLRLGKEQRCYDFCVWYATTGTESNCDLGNMDLPFLNVKNAEVFEPDSGKLVRKYRHLSHCYYVAQDQALLNTPGLSGCILAVGKGISRDSGYCARSAYLWYSSRTSEGYFDYRRSKLVHPRATKANRNTVRIRERPKHAFPVCFTQVWEELNSSSPISQSWKCGGDAACAPI